MCPAIDCLRCRQLYLTSCPADPADKAAEYMQNRFVIPYEKMMAAAKLKLQFEEACKKNSYADQMRLGKQIIATEPDNPVVSIIMGIAGLGDASLLKDSAEYAKKSITMIEAGKPFAPLTSKDQALAFLNYVFGRAAHKNAPTDAIPYFLKAARLESELKKNPQLYADLAGAYGEGPIAQLSDEYHTKHTTETLESKLALANINQMIDQQIDALARAAALSTNAANKKALMELLTGLYKDRNKSEAGLNELLTNMLATPIPDIPTPLTSLPTPPPSPTPATH